jgi:6-phosphogluconolactonase
MTRLSVFDNADGVAESAAARIGSAAFAAMAARGRFMLGLSGGRTPQLLYRRLAIEVAGAPIDWSRVRIYFADERAVRPEDAESNYRMVCETLVDPAGISLSSVYRMKGENPNLTEAAEEYESQLSEPLDVLVLGVGEDGHIASLFPRGAALGEREKRVAVVREAPKPPPNRLTLTPRAIAEARVVLVLATGGEKAPAVAAVIDEEGPIEEVPARLVRERNWLVDRDAAAGLVRRGG